MYSNLLKEFLGNIDSSNVLLNEPMKNHCSFKIGGPADIIITPGNIEELKTVIKICKNQGIGFFVLGNGTNILVKDKGIRGVVIKLVSFLKNYTIKDDIIESESGILLSDLANIALENELSGAEFASGIPGTLGGAVAMNAGAYGFEMKDIVIETEYMTEDGNIKVIDNNSHLFGYRASIIQSQNGIVLSSKIKLSKSSKSTVKNLMDELNTKRRNKQPLEMPSAGSIFIRPQGYYVGELIETCGLKGYTIGGAQVSEKHSGFIVNVGNATAEDVMNLIGYIQKVVNEKYGVKLRTEIKIIGE